MRLWILVGFHSSLIPDNSREAATARLPWAPQIFRARVTGFGQVFMSTDWRIKLYCTVLYFTHPHRCQMIQQTKLCFQKTNN